MNDQLTEDPQTIVDRIQQQATRYETPCGDGKMIWHLWDQSGGAAPVVALFHGGAGSWRHWIRTIPALVPTYRVLVPDLPGLGESDFPPDGDDAFAVADDRRGRDRRHHRCRNVLRSRRVFLRRHHGGLRRRVARQAGSFRHDHRLVRRRRMGSAVNLEKVRHLEGQERRDTHRINLNRLMIADPAKIDDLAILIQDWNTVRSRLRTPAISRSGAIMRAIDQLQSPLNGMWGELDAPANPKGPERVATLRAHCPDADIRLIPKTGHWAAYESADIVNATLLEMLARTRP